MQWEAKQGVDSFPVGIDFARDASQVRWPEMGRNAQVGGSHIRGDRALR